jgi:hypothetical protein
VAPRFGRIEDLSTETKGQIFSPQLLSRSGMNLKGKEDLDLPWDIHAEWLLECSDCHFLPNDPAYIRKGEGLHFDGRKIGIDEFLSTPDHNFSKGRSAQGTVADHLDGTMRRCEDCHDTSNTHEWLPYKRRHFDRVLCEACHIPIVNAPARSVTDWTVLTPNGEPRVEYRGTEGDIDDPAALVEGYKPVLLPREGTDGEQDSLAPHNLITSWYWVHGEPPLPVRIEELRDVFLDGRSYHEDILETLDSDGDGGLDGSELVLDSPDKAAVVRGRLEAAGLSGLRIVAEIQPYGLHHGVVTGKWATRDCTRCHSKFSDITRRVALAAAVPGGVLPSPVGDTNALMTGDVQIEDGALWYAPATREDGFYILGRDRWKAIDLAGAIAVLATFAAVAVHGGIRVHVSRSRRRRS